MPAAPSVSQAALPLVTRSSRWLVVAAVAVAVVGVLCGWLIFLHLHNDISGNGLGWGLAFAFAPVLPLVALLLWLDRWAPTPTGYLALALSWGAFVATALALLVNSWVAEQIGDVYGPSARTAVFVAPWVEEAAKGAVVLLVAVVRRHQFAGIVDAVVLAGLTGIGFAFTENIVYYGNLFERVAAQDDTAAALDAVRELFLWRGVAMPFAHPIFTMMLGVGVGIAVRQRHPAVRIIAPVTGYVIAVVMHMGYNAAASFTTRSAGLWPMYLLVMLPLLAAAVAFVVWVRHRERQVLAARLADYAVYGWLDRDEIPSLVSITGRRAARRRLKQTSPEAAQAMRTYQRLAVELAFLRDKAVRGVAGPEILDRERAIISALRALRAQVGFQPVGAAMPVGGTPAYELAEARVPR